MLFAPNPTTSPPKPRKRWLPRLWFSLRTLLFFVLLIGSATTLWLNWEPWYRVSTLTNKLERISFAAFSADCKRVVWIGEGPAIHITDVQTGTEISTPQALPPARFQMEGVLDGRPILLTTGKADTENESPAPPPDLPKDEPWRAEFRARHPTTLTIDWIEFPLNDGLSSIFTRTLKDKFVFNQEVIDSGRAQSEITLRVTKMDASEALSWILRLADVEAEYEDGVLHIVNKETFAAHLRQTIDNTVCVWDLESLKPIASLSGQTSKIMELALSSNGRFVLAASENGTTRIWELPGGKQTAAFQSTKGSMYRVALSNSGRRAALQLEGGKIASWDAEKGITVLNKKSANFVAISPDGSRGCYVDHKSAELFDLEAGTKLLEKQAADQFRSPEASPLFSPAPHRLLINLGEPSYLVDSRDGRELAQYEWNALTGTFSPDGVRFSDLHGNIFDSEDGQKLTVLPDRNRSVNDIWIWGRNVVLPPVVLVDPFAIALPRSPSPQFSFDGKTILSLDCFHLGVWTRRRPEYWWGIAWLPEFWLAALFAGALIWSVWRDRRRIES